MLRTSRLEIVAFAQILRGTLRQMAVSKRLLVGLGNPGVEYENTRHNVGFAVIDRLSDKLKIKLKTKGEALIGWGTWKGWPIGLMKPLTYMNRSGIAVEKLARSNKLSPGDIFVVLDDINLPVGKTRIRARGGHGGHNGLEDIIDWLGEDSFPRLRIGIGNDFQRGGQSDYVLSRFEDDDRLLIDEAVSKSADAALFFVSEGLEIVMNRFNR